jgi:Xaa-Pro aminopeptidase
MRIEKLKEAMAKSGADAALITSAENVSYYSRFSGTSSQLLVTGGEKYFFTDFRYTEQAAAETDFTVVETKAAARVQTIFEYAAKHGAKKIGADLSEISYAAYKSYLQYTAEENLVDLTASIAAQRSIKDAEEIALIAKGAKHNDLLFDHMCKILKAGMSEMDIRAEIIYYMNKNGADIAFAPIIASGENSSLPHATPTGRRIAPGDFVTMDYGCRFGGYCSDFTRTVAISHIDKEQQRGYDIVKCAGDRALAALAAGKGAREIDAIARGYIEKAGYGEAFGHGLGHGVGLMIHEAPTLNEVSDAELQDGMVVTIEPGIYLKGRWGVRIEDLCVVRNGGCENLTSAPRELIIID